jgi:hypothetical protein
VVGWSVRAFRVGGDASGVHPFVEAFASDLALLVGHPVVRPNLAARVLVNLAAIDFLEGFDALANLVVDVEEVRTAL